MARDHTPVSLWVSVKLILSAILYDLQQELVKLLAKGAITAGEIRNRLNGQPLGLDVSLENVLDALRQLEGQRIVECLWRISQDAT